MTGYIRKQLNEIALPIMPRPGLNIKVTFKGVLADPESRKKWLDRFSYGYAYLSVGNITSDDKILQ